MEVLLWIILIFFILGYAFRLFFRYALPWLLAQFLKKQQEKFSQMSGQGNPQQPKAEGEVKIRKSPKTSSSTDDIEFGEYVDYEDI